MNVEDLIEHYGSPAKTARAIGVDDSTISKWRERGGLVPLKAALKIVDLTRGEVSLRLRDY
jgi:DNA-binding transcriptional regulator YdaS (Cro superfamily)